jgi:HEAT repeat protein
MSPEHSEDKGFEYQMPNLDIPNPPRHLSYPEFEDYRNREILKANGISLSEAELIAALEQRIGILQAAAAHTLGSFSNRAAITTLKRLLSSQDDLVKVEAAYALARLGVPEGKDILIQCLDYRLDAYLCPAIAAGYLAQLDEPRGFHIIVRSFKVNIAAIRMLACKQLYFFAPFQDTQDGYGNLIDVFPVFELALKDSDPNIQWQALVQLREICSTKSCNILENYIEEAADEQLREIAKEILKRAAESRNKGNLS